jgi:hypothetical protein
VVEKKSKIGTVYACVREGCDWEKLAPEEEKPAAAAEETPVAVKV